MEFSVADKFMSKYALEKKKNEKKKNVKRHLNIFTTEYAKRYRTKNAHTHTPD